MRSHGAQICPHSQVGLFVVRLIESDHRHWPALMWGVCPTPVAQTHHLRRNGSYHHAPELVRAGVSFGFGYAEAHGLSIRNDRVRGGPSGGCQRSSRELRWQAVRDLAAFNFDDASLAQMINKIRKLVFGGLLLEESVHSAAKGLLCSWLARIATYQIGDDGLNLGIDRWRKGALKKRHVGNALGALNENTLSLEVFDQRIKASILRNNMKER